MKHDGHTGTWLLALIFGLMLMTHGFSMVVRGCEVLGQFLVP
jgi:hypothetical protein